MGPSTRTMIRRGGWPMPRSGELSPRVACCSSLYLSLDLERFHSMDCFWGLWKIANSGEASDVRPVELVTTGAGGAGDRRVLLRSSHVLLRAVPGGGSSAYLSSVK